jgi:hypothetical protein
MAAINPAASKRNNLTGYLLHPAAVTLLLSALLVGWVIAQAGGDPLELARLGSGSPGSVSPWADGYDGQFTYAIARDLHPEIAARSLDAPAYRYQRILLPLVARLVSFGNQDAIPWVLVFLGVVSHAVGVWAVARLLEGWGANRWWALVYGLWAGFLLSVRLDLPEPLAFGLVAWAILANERGKPLLSSLLYALALFAKEVTIVFVAAQLLADVTRRRWDRAALLAAVALLPFGLFQGWLWLVFGEPGIASGGDMATPFEIIPYLGLLRIGAYSIGYLLAMLVVFGPTIVLPSLWGIWNGVKCWTAGEKSVLVFALLCNALSIPILPFSTFRETGGLLRFACGLVLAVILFAARYKKRRVLKYSLGWLALDAFLFK